MFHSRPASEAARRAKERAHQAHGYASAAVDFTKKGVEKIRTRREPWSTGRTIELPPDVDLRGKATILAPSMEHDLASVVAALNSGAISAPEGFCVMPIVASRTQILLYRKGMKTEQLGFGDLSQSDSNSDDDSEDGERLGGNARHASRPGLSARESKDQLEVEEQVNGMEFCCNCDYHRKYSQELAYDLRCRFYWSGMLCQDYAFHVANWHPVISCFCCHPAHPYTKCERILVLLLFCALTILPSVALTFKYRDEDRADLKWAILFCVTCPAVLLQMVLEQFIMMRLRLMDWSTCPCCGCCFLGCACVVDLIGKCSLCMAAAVTLIVMGISALIIADQGPDYFIAAARPFWEARLQSWAFWFLTDLFLPCCGFMSIWKSQKEQTEKAKAKAKAEAGKRTTLPSRRSSSSSSSSSSGEWESEEEVGWWRRWRGRG